MRDAGTVWLFDLDNTLHDAGAWIFGALNVAMGEYVQRLIGLAAEPARLLAREYWRRYGTTLLGLIRHHGVKPADFLHATHQFTDLEQRLTGHRHDFVALARLPGRKFILTNAPRAYAMRVLNTLRLADCFDGVISIEDMMMFGHLRPKPDARMFAYVLARLKVRASDCVLIEDTLEHQKAARSLGMHTVWMQRYLEGRYPGPAWRDRNKALPPAEKTTSKAAKNSPEVGVHPCRKPPYVCAKMKSLQRLFEFQ